MRLSSTYKLLITHIIKQQIQNRVYHDAGGAVNSHHPIASTVTPVILIMETISDICENLGDATLQECQLILDNPQDPVAESFAMHLDKPVLESMISTVKGLRGEATNDNAIVKILKKISAYAVFNALNASTIEG